MAPTPTKRRNGTHKANLPFWFGIVVRPHARKKTAPGFTRIRWLRPSGIKGVNFRTTQETFDVQSELLHPQPATRSAEGAYQINAGADVMKSDEELAGDAATGVKRSSLVGWNTECELCDQVGRLALCDFWCGATPRCLADAVFTRPTSRPQQRGRLLQVRLARVPQEVVGLRRVRRGAARRLSG